MMVGVGGRWLGGGGRGVKGVCKCEGAEFFLLKYRQTV